MQLRDSDWEKLTPHLSLGYYGPPRAVYQAVAAVVDPSNIVGAWPAFKAGDPSSWSVWVITHTAIAYVEIEFAAADYTITVEDEQAGRSQQVAWTVRQAWARPLDRVNKLTVGSVGPRTPTHWFAVDQLTLTFDGGDEVTVPGQQSAGAQPDSRRRSDEFIGAIRAALSL